uniref:hypothetical protein n=1 Tax=Kitasatospora xanthocidica TaxID=83382 RepID=UPI001674E0CC|nr:hypothetical protein [Kitasatospora xanthocidica]
MLDRGIAHTYIKPASPHLNGKVERSHRVDAEEFHRILAGFAVDDTGVLHDNSENGRTPTSFTAHTAPSAARPRYERLKQKIRTRM